MKVELRWLLALVCVASIVLSMGGLWSTFRLLAFDYFVARSIFRAGSSLAFILSSSLAFYASTHVVRFRYDPRASTSGAFDILFNHVCVAVCVDDKLPLAQPLSSLLL